MTSILGGDIIKITSLLGEIKRKEKALDRDEILAKSREEYKKNNKDEMMVDIMSKAGKLSMEVGMVVVALIIVVEGLFFNSFNFSVWTVYYAILATQSFVYYHRLKRKETSLHRNFACDFGNHNVRGAFYKTEQVVSMKDELVLKTA